jgi:hypothetical protein
MMDHWWTLWWRHHCSQNPQRWLLLAHFIQIFSCICKEMPTMPKVSLGEKRNFFSPATCDHRTPLSTMGVGCNREINPNSSQLHKYILTTTDYFTRWSEAIPLKTINENQVTLFLESHIITRFGIPESLVFDNAKYFSSLKLTEFSLEWNIKVKYSTNYYPQGNGLARVN